MPLKLTAETGGQSYELRDGATLVVGRALGSDVPVVDPTVSRRHAEVQVEPAGLRLRDLGSANGTWVNGSKIDDGLARVGDVVGFGRVVFRLEGVAEARAAEAHASAPSTDGATIVRQRRLGERPHTPRSEDATPSQPAAAEPDLTARKLALLLEVSRELGRAAPTATILDRIATVVFEIMPVDRVAILLAGETGELTPRVSRDRWGSGVVRAVPRSIARTVAEERVAVLTDNAPADARFDGHSIVAQRVRSAMCTPLLGGGDRLLGVLYVDSASATQRFDDEDLDFLVAFSGIAAVAIENGDFAERIRREALVRASFERFFAPALAARIAQRPDAAVLGGERRVVTVMFTDLRGFTPLSETMPPEETARLLSEYLGAMAETVFEHGGVLDKFLGDGVMAQWGAPLAAPDDTDRAIAAALAMQARLAALNARWRAEGRPELAIGIGIDRGDVFAGNIGSERRMEYTVIGDAVNVAARLCECASGGEILVTDEVARSAGPGARLESCPPRQLKGASGVRAVFRVLA